MRICVITPYFYPHPGGSQRYIEELYVALRAVNPDVDVDVICYNTDGQQAKSVWRGLNIYRVPCLEVLRGQFAIPNHLALLALLRDLKKRHGHYDLVNSHTRFFENSWWAPLAAKYLGAKSILTDHCAGHPEHGSALVQLATSFVDQVVVPLIARQYDAVTVVSQATQKFLRGLGVAESTVIYGGVDLDVFQGGSQGKTGQPLTVSFIGRMIPTKGPELFLKMAQQLSSRYPKVVFQMIGDGPLLTSLKEKAHYAHLDQLRFLGAVHREKVADLLAETDILVHPSTHHEGFPMILVEAGASGCAVIATNQGGVTELIQDQKTGLLAEPRVEDLVKKLEMLLDSPDVRTHLAQNLHIKVVKELNWTTIAKRFNAYVLELLKK